MEQQPTQKKAFYKSKAFVFPVLAVMMVGLVFAVSSFFHSTDATIVIDEARSSIDVDYSLNAFSGETVTQDVVIHNAANVLLCAEVSFEQATNTGVTYDTNMPFPVTLAPGTNTTATSEFYVSEVSDAGSATGTVYYTKVAC